MVDLEGMRQLPPPPEVVVLADRVVLVELTRTLALELVVLEHAVVASLLEVGRPARAVPVGEA